MFDFSISISLFLLFELFKFVVFEKGFQKPNSPHSWVNLFQTKYIIILNVMCFQIWYIITKCHKINYTFKKKKLEYIYYFLFIFFRVFLILSWVLINFRSIDILFQNIHQYFSIYPNTSIKSSCRYICQNRYFHFYLLLLFGRIVINLICEFLYEITFLVKNFL